MTTIPEALTQGARLLHEGNLSQAEAAYRQIVGANPGVAQAWYLLGSITHMTGRLVEAVGYYQHALRLAPALVEARNNLGVALQALGSTEAALECFRDAIRLRPDFADAYSNLGNALQEQGNLDDAIACYRQAIQRQPDYLDAHNNLGNALRGQRRFSEALASYNEALRIKPDQPYVHLSRALLWLQTGDFERGWVEYEWRLKCKDFAIPAFPRPMWDGSFLDGQTILVYGDHGLGDTLQFIRYAPLVRDRGGRIVAAVRKPLARIAASCPGMEQVFSDGEQLPDFAVFVPAMSLPRIFHTTVATVPGRVPYLAADDELVKRWTEEVRCEQGFRIGIAWQGNPSYPRDRQRSFRLSRFESLAMLPGVRLYSLQKGFGSEQIAESAGCFSVIDLGNRIDDFADSAAIMRNLDLVITADTSLAHLAGAIGTCVWVALPFDADWRWQLEREDSPWYPTMRLFRQRRPGDWDEVFERIRAELAAKLGSSVGC
jgi:Tfp pilus assembly protein PilF